MSKKKKSFEESLKRLQEISEMLENDDVSLENSISLYEEGIKLSKECFSALDKAELKVEELNDDLEDEINKSQKE
jgi:exodeoxyribonuclease VII small subunit